MTDTMIEKAARAAMSATSANHWENSVPARSFYMSVVRAVLAAIREPDEPMLKAGVQFAPGNVWRAMIDAILAEEPKP